MVIRFWPGCLGTKPDALTHRPDLYPSGGKGNYGKVNPHNLKHRDFVALDTDLTAKSYLTDTNDPKYKNWSKDELGYVRINGRIFVPESGPF